MVWIDLETTGLNVEEDVIIEICVAVTDGLLNTIEEGPELRIHYPDMEDRIKNMGEWCTRTHTRSGLLDMCRTSKTSLKDAEDQIVAFLEATLDEKDWKNRIRRYIPIAGNSVHFDVTFIKKWMPRIMDYTSYRIVDVSSIHEVCKRINPRLLESIPQKRHKHTARSDILESIKELSFYYERFFLHFEPPPPFFDQGMQVISIKEERNMISQAVETELNPPLMIDDDDGLELQPLRPEKERTKPPPPPQKPISMMIDDHDPLSHPTEEKTLTSRKKKPKPKTKSCC